MNILCFSAKKGFCSDIFMVLGYCTAFALINGLRLLSLCIAEPLAANILVTYTV